MPQNHHSIDLDPFAPPHPNPGSGCPVPPHVAPVASHRNQDTVTWHCHQDFEITKITPTNPVLRALPFKALLGTPGGGQPARFRVNSGPIGPHSGLTHYQVTFKVAGEERDPHFDGDR